MTLFHLLWLFLLWLNPNESLQQSEVKCELTLPPVPGTTYEPANRNSFSPGEKLRVTCGDRYWILDSRGLSAETTCKRDGEWTFRPVCQEVTCSRPRDTYLSSWHDSSSQQKKMGDIVVYRCATGYRSTAIGIWAMCTRDGWEPNPLCQANAAIKCELTLPPVPGTTYEPAYRNRFSPGEKVRVTCGDRYWISDGRSRSAETTCKEDGQWTVAPVCQEVTCSRPRDRCLLHWGGSWFHQKKLGDTVRYGCRSGYKRTDRATWATCTRDGWEPNPLCQEIPLCGRPPALEDGDVKNTTKERYNHSETIEYMCQSYYTMEGEPYRTCYNGKWTGQMRCLNPCVANEDEMRQHNITFKSNDYDKYLVHDEIIEFKCANGLPVGKVAMRQRCNSGVIVLPTCREDLS